MKNFCKNKNRSAMGNIAKIAAAPTRFKLFVFSPKKLDNATVIVFTSSACKKNIANWKSFHIYTHDIIRIVAVIGLSSGNTILKKIPTVLAPSIRAASSNSFGIVERIKPEYKKMVNGMNDATLFSTAIVLVFIIPISTTNWYKGTNAVNGGITMIEMNNTNTNLFSLV